MHYAYFGNQRDRPVLTARKLETLYIAKNNPKSSEPQSERLVQALCFAGDRFL